MELLGTKAAVARRTGAQKLKSRFERCRANRLLKTINAKDVSLGFNPNFIFCFRQDLQGQPEFFFVYPVLYIVSLYSHILPILSILSD